MSTHRCFDRLIDDAAVFPPGNASLADAVVEHHEHQSSSHAWLVGPLLVRDHDVVELDGVNEQPLRIGIIGTAGPAELAQAVIRATGSQLLTVVGAEIAVAADADLSAAAVDLLMGLAWAKDGPTVSIELPRPGVGVSAAWIVALEGIGSDGHQVKLRTGGVVAEAYPSEAELAAVLAVLVGERQRFKLTAGLHRAVRNTQDGTDFEQHGFLNVLAAVHGLLAGATSEDAAATLAERDGRALAAIVSSWDADQVDAVRRIFRGFGSCSIAEPYADLVDLGLAE
ncbi:hypothetical protein C6I20_12900 [Aeromicrobium sp. A1-2]|uniref:hypothetical protein n=1 Tax=Aeromicrobium sp. A1-2 TaxID=2107713 RepID=UPI000E488240|nr:hypothetical protein [Aeromicrobium sp. A1-2]AXT85992.1 hypothetical protein C6I20_12900 [Aeromicrobium sp. A1-2]